MSKSDADLVELVGTLTCAKKISGRENPRGTVFIGQSQSDHGACPNIGSKISIDPRRK